MSYPMMQSSYAGGEVTPALRGRVDLAKVRTGLATQRNWYSVAHGGSITRPGTQIVDEVIDSAVRSRLIPFQFRDLPAGQTYTLEFGALKMRVMKDGGYVLEATKIITGITQANPATVTSNAHGYANGDDVLIAAVTGMTQVNGRRFKAAGVTANTFQLQGVDSSLYTAYAAGGTAARYYTVTTPYTEADLPLLKFIQSQDKMTLTHPSYAPRELTRTGHAAWTLSAITFASLVPAPAGLASSSPGAGFSYGVTAVNDTTGEESVLSAVVSATTQTSTLTWAAVAGCSNYFVYKAGAGGIYGFIGIAGTGLAFTDATISPNFGTTAPGTRNPFSSADNYPGSSTYWDQRQYYGRTNNDTQTVWASQPGNFKNMSVSSPTQDTDAITKSVVSKKANEIRAFVPLEELLVFTSGGIFVGRTGSSDTVTPTSLTFKPQGEKGISHLPPLVVNNEVIFVQEKGASVYNLAYQPLSTKYLPKEISILSRHLFTGYTVQEWCYAEVPYGLIWAVRSDGVLLSFTLLQDQDVYAWARHDTDGLFESVSTVSEGAEDAVYFIVKRTIGGVTKRYVERLVSRQFTSLTESWCVDCGLRYAGAPATTISGLGHLEGKAVSVLADGVVRLGLSVLNGSITLPVAASVVIVGLGFVCDMQTLPVEAGPPTVQGKLKRVVNTALKLDHTRGLKVGPNDQQLVTVMAGSKFGAVGSATETYTGTHTVIIPPAWNTDGSIFIRQEFPLPGNVLAHIPGVEVGS